VKTAGLKQFRQANQGDDESPKLLLIGLIGEEDGQTAYDPYGSVVEGKRSGEGQGAGSDGGQCLRAPLGIVQDIETNGPGIALEGIDLLHHAMGGHEEAAEAVIAFDHVGGEGVEVIDAAALADERGQNKGRRQGAIQMPL
jgi:hypothetical protein